MIFRKTGELYLYKSLYQKRVKVLLSFNYRGFAGRKNRPKDVAPVGHKRLEQYATICKYIFFLIPEFQIQSILPVINAAPIDSSVTFYTDVGIALSAHARGSKQQCLGCCWVWVRINIDPIYTILARARIIFKHTEFSFFTRKRCEQWVLLIQHGKVALIEHQRQFTTITLENTVQNFTISFPSC